jgi:hypothetical protein
MLACRPRNRYSKVGGELDLAPFVRDRETASSNCPASAEGVNIARPGLEDPVDALTLDRLKQAVLDAGFEIYRIQGDEIRVAERVRMHLMDSAVCVTLHSNARISLTVRSQRSDFPMTPAQELFERVRNTIGKTMEARGFHEVRAETRDITDPVDASHLLDVWHELTFAKDAPSLTGMLDDLRWALSVPKCIDPS